MGQSLKLSGWSVVQELGFHKWISSVVVGEDLNLMQRSSRMRTPNLEVVVNSKEFLNLDVVIAFSMGHLLGNIGDFMIDSVDW